MIQNPSNEVIKEISNITQKINLAPYLKTKTETLYEVALKSSSDKAYVIV